MTWFRVDDGFHNHPKVMQAGTAATGLFVRCGSYAAQHLTDGFVPAEIVRVYGSTALAKRLVEAGLFVVEPGGWRIHDYLSYNPSRAKVEEERTKAAERLARFRAKRSGNGVANGVCNAAPVPARPEGTWPVPAADEDPSWSAFARGGARGRAQLRAVDNR